MHRLLKGKLFVIGSILFVCTLSLVKANSPQITVVWSTENSSSQHLLKDQSGNALSSGSALNGDGCFLELGYFSQGSTSTPFEGTWTPLSQNTHIGDSSTGFGFDDGKFSFSSTFTQNSSLVATYKSRPAEFSFNLGFQVNTSALSTGKPICIRFYDSPTKNGAARYNTVTGSDWLWPSFPSGSTIPSNLYLMIASGSPPAGSYWKYGAIFEDSFNPYKATLLDNFSLSLSVDSPQGYGSGTINNTSGNEYEGGTYVDISASAEAHSMFYQWIGDDIVDPYSADTQVLITKDQEIFAQFLKIPYFLNLDSDLNGTVSGGGGGDYGDQVTITAMPHQGYVFSHWEEDGDILSDLNSSPIITITGNRDLTAIFSPIEYQLSLTTHSGGSYELIDTYNHGTSHFYHNSAYDLSVIPDPHYIFAGWTGNSQSLEMLDNPNSPNTKITLTGNATLAGYFSELSYPLQILSTPGFDTLTPESNSFPALSPLTVSTTPLDGYIFDGWIDPYNILTDASSATTEANMSKLQYGWSASITALFSLKDYNSSTVVITHDGNGTTSLQSDGGKYTHFGIYNLNALPNRGYRFDHWSGEGNLTHLSLGPEVAENKLLVEGPIHLEAKFSPADYKLDTLTSGGGVVEGPESFNIKSNPTISAQPMSGWEFLQWTGDTSYLVSPNSNTSQLDLSVLELRDIELTAEFQLISQTTFVDVEGNGSISFALDSSSFSSSGKELTINSDLFSEISLLASPQTGWRFSRLDFHSSPVPEYSSIHDSLTGEVFFYFYAEVDNNLSTVFELKEYNSSEVSIQTSTGGMVLLNQNNSFVHFQTYSVEAVPNLGYQFSHWEGDGHELLLHLGNKSAQNSFTVDGPLQLTAVFTENNYSISLSHEGGGTTSGPSSFSVLDDPLPVVSANPNPGWDFESWTGDTNFLLAPLSSTTSITLSESLQDLDLTARFKREIYTLNQSIVGNGKIKYKLNNSAWLQDPSSSFNLQVNSGDFISFSALPDDGWKFDSWVKIPDPQLSLNSSDSLEKTSPLLSFQAYSSGDFTPSFSRRNYLLQISSETGGGETSGAGTYAYEDIIQISAIPLKGYLFDQWVGSGVDSLNHSAYKVNNNLTMPAQNVDLKATFLPIPYRIFLDKPENGDISLSGQYLEQHFTGGSEFNATSEIILQATPSQSYGLKNWEWNNSNGESGTSTNPTFPLPSLDANYSFSAVFELLPPDDIAYSFQSSPVTGGSIEENRAKASLAQRSFFVRPFKGYSFTGWTFADGTFINQSPHSLELDINISEGDTITAHFAPKIHNLQIEIDPEMGTAEGNSTGLSIWDKALLSATPLQHHSFIKWEPVSRFDFEVTSQTSKIFTNLSRLHLNNSESPELTLYRGYDYYFTNSLENGDEIFFSTNPIHDQSSKYTEGVTYFSAGLVTSNIHFQVPANAPDTLYYFSSQNKLNGNRINILNKPSSSFLSFPENTTIEPYMLNNYRVKAVFIPDVITLNTIDSLHGSISFEKKEEYLWGEELNITATPDDHWSFSHWVSNAGITPASAPNAVIKLLEKTELEAVFKKTEYPLNLLKSNNRFGDVYTSNNKDSANYGDEIEIIAAAHHGKLFTSWTLVSGVEKTPDSNLFSPSTVLKVSGPVEIIANFESKQFDVKTSVLTLDHNGSVIQEVGGIIKTDQPIYYHEDNAILSFLPADGFHLSHWVDIENDSIFYNNPLTLPVDKSKNIQAVAEKTTYNVSLSVVPQNSGIIQSNKLDPYFWESNLSLSATAKEHWNFSHWESSVDLDNSVEPTTHITIREDLSIKAVFTPIAYSLEIRSDPSSGFGTAVTLEPQSFYNHFDPILLEANPAPGKKFTSWTMGPGMSIINPGDDTSGNVSFRISADSWVQANFDSKNFEISAAITTIDQDGLPLDPQEPGGKVLGTGFHKHGNQAQLSFQPYEGYEFVEWKDQSDHTLSYLPDLNITVSGDQEIRIIAKKLLSLQLSSAPIGGGNPFPNKGKLSEKTNGLSFHNRGDQVVLDANASRGKKLAYWESPISRDDQNQSSALVPFTIEEDTNITAHYEPQQYQARVSLLTKNKAGEAHDFKGAIIRGKKAYYYYEEETEILCIPDDGFKFVKWINLENDQTLSTDPLLNIAVFGELNLQAIVQEADLEISVKLHPEGIGSVIATYFDKNETYSSDFKLPVPYGTEITFIAQSNEDTGYFFKSYSSKTLISENKKITFLAKQNDHFDVQFAPSIDNIVNLKILSEPSDAGGFNGQGEFSYNSNHTIHAVPKTGWIFSHWEGEGIKNILSSITTINLDSNKTIYGVFVPDPDGSESIDDTQEFLLFASAFNQKQGKVDGAGIIKAGWTEIHAQPEAGFIFDYWEGDGIEDNTSATTSVLMDRDRSVVAHFEPLYQLTLLSAPLNSSTLSGSGTFPQSSVPIEAFAADGYVFSHWDGAGIDNPNSAATSVSLNQDTTLTVHFKKVHSLSLSSNPSGSGTLTGSGSFTESSVQIKALADDGYIFSHWEGTGVGNPNSAVTVVSLDQDTSLVAHFARSKFSLRVRSNNTSFGKAYGSGSYLKSWRSISAVANEGYEFSHWSGKNIDNSLSADTSVWLASDANITAHFQAVSGVDGSEEVEEGEGWWDNPWFGFYWKINDTTWAFHEHLGWINIRSESDESTWVWIDKLGDWYWTAKANYPYLQKGSADMKWIWVNLDKSNPYQLIYYDYGQSPGWKQK